MNCIPDMFVTEIDLRNQSAHTRYFRFPLDGDKDFDYRARGSVNAFAYSGKRRNYKPHYKKAEFVYHFQYVTEYEMMQEVNMKTFGRNIFEHVPIIKLANLWEFYELIGWEYKNKKWIK